MSKRVGWVTESLAALFLLLRGLRIIRRNYFCSCGELDLIALHRERPRRAAPRRLEAVVYVFVLVRAHRPLEDALPHRRREPRPRQAAAIGSYRYCRAEGAAAILGHPVPTQSTQLRLRFLDQVFCEGVLDRKLFEHILSFPDPILLQANTNKYLTNSRSTDSMHF